MEVMSSDEADSAVDTFDLPAGGADALGSGRTNRWA